MWGRLTGPLVVLGVRLFALVVGALPPPVADGLGRALGWGWYRLVPIRRRVARENVARALGGELGPAAREALVAAHFRHLGRSFVELLRFARRPPAALAAQVEVEGRANLEAALAQGRGVLILTAHLGNWEILVRLGSLLDRPVRVVTRRFSSPGAERAWRALRRGGAALVTADGAARTLVAALRRNEVVGFVLDQHAATPRAVLVPFFGRPAATTPDLVRLARLTGAPIVPVFTFRRGDDHVVSIGGAVDLPATGDARADILQGTARCTAVIEDAIRRAPEQWLWIHRRWKGRPSACPGPEPARALDAGRT